MSDMSRSNEYWIDHISSSDLMKFFQLLFVSIMIELQVKRYAALCQLRWLVISLPAAKIVVVFGQDWSY